MLHELIADHPLRRALTHELHARPSPALVPPGRATFLAMLRPSNAREDLETLLSCYGAEPPGPDSSHHAVELDGLTFKWELHTEFVSYTVFATAADGAIDSPCDVFPADWLRGVAGEIVAAVQVHVRQAAGVETASRLLDEELAPGFVAESLAASHVADRQVLAAGDFRIRDDGFSRFVLVTQSAIGPRRLGRLVQRLLEIEVYRALAMLALPVAREMGPRLGEVDRELAALMERFAADEGGAHATLASLTRLSAEIEAMSAASAFRFGAAAAYRAIVSQRVQVLREERVEGRQLFSEFMSRRFNPAMRTCESVERRLEELSRRAARAANLLRTRVDVALEEQNQKLLESMDRRAALQLRLQETVEGLSVVAISYYAVNLAAYVLGPPAGRLGFDKSTVLAVVVVPMVGLVWAFVRRLRRRQS